MAACFEHSFLGAAFIVTNTVLVVRKGMKGERYHLQQKNWGDLSGGRWGYLSSYSGSRRHLRGIFYAYRSSNIAAVYALDTDWHTGN